MTRYSLLILLFFVAIWQTPAQEHNALQLYETGMSYSNRGEYREAVHYFRKSLEKNARYIDAHYGAAVAYFSLGDWPRSSQHYNRVIHYDKNHIEAHTGVALVYIKVRQFSQAKRHLDFVKKNVPGNVNNNYAYGVYYFQLRQFSLARSYFQKTIRLSPRHILSLIGLARVQFTRGRFDTSKRLLERASAINAEHFEIHLLNGELMLKKAINEDDKIERGRLFEKALRKFLAAQKLRPENLNVQLQLVLLDLFTQKIDKAYLRSAKLLDLKKESNRVLYLNGVLAQKSKDPVRAISILRRALHLSPQDSIVRYKLESLLLKSLTGYTADKNRLAQYHRRRANVYYKSRKYDQFRIHLNRALELNPSCLPCLNMVLDYSLRSSDRPTYVRVLRRLQRRDASNPRLKFRLERALKKLNLGLASKNNLYNNYERPGVATYKRTPDIIFIFDPDTGKDLGYHVDLPSVVADALTHQLLDFGSVQSVPLYFRKVFEGRVKKEPHQKPRLPFYYPYKPEYLRQIEFVENAKSLKVHYILTGFVESDKYGIVYKASIIDKQTATVLAKHTIRKKGRDAVTALVSDLVVWVRNYLPTRGLIIQIKNSNVFLNIGKLDKVKKGDKFSIHRLGENKGLLEVVEIDSYISRAKVLKGNVDSLDQDDVVVKIKKPG